MLKSCHLFSRLYVNISSHEKTWKCSQTHKALQKILDNVLAVIYLPSTSLLTTLVCHRSPVPVRSMLPGHVHQNMRQKSHLIFLPILPRCRLHELTKSIQWPTLAYHTHRTTATVSAGIRHKFGAPWSSSSLRRQPVLLTEFQTNLKR